MVRKVVARRVRTAMVAVAAAIIAMVGGIGLDGAAPAGAQELPTDRVTVVMTELEPFVIDDDGEPDGFYAEIWDEVAASLDVDYDTIWVDSFGDLLPALAEGRADVAVAPLAPTAEREASYDFTSAVVVSGPQLAYADRLNGGRPSLLGAFFDGQVMSLAGLALAALVVLAHVIWFVERNLHDEDGDFHRSYPRGVWDGLWWSAVTVTTVGYGDKAPKSTAGKVVALVAMSASLVLVAAFVSQITSVLADRADGNPVEGLDDVTGPIGVIEGSSFATYLEDQGEVVAGYENQDEVFAAARDGEVDVVVANPFALHTFAASYGLVPVDGVLYDEFETFGLPQGSPWREPINQAVARLHATGEIARLADNASS